MHSLKVDAPFFVIGSTRVQTGSASEGYPIEIAVVEKVLLDEFFFQHTCSIYILVS